MDDQAPASKAADDADASDRPCPFCGYNLRGIDSQRCPECGREFDYEAFGRAHIPWEHRRQIGRVRAYWRTVVGFTFRPVQWARVGATPRYADAVRFRSVTVALAFAAILLPALACRIFIRWSDFRGDQYSRWYFFSLDDVEDYLVEMFRQPASLVILLAGVLLALIAITGVPAFFFRARSLTGARLTRSLVLGQYTCAPLAWSPITVGMLAGALALDAWRQEKLYQWEDSRKLVILAALLLGVQLLLWWLGTVRVLRAAGDAGWGRTITCAILHPLVCLVLLVMIPAGMQLVSGYLVLVVVSLFRR